MREVDALYRAPQTHTEHPMQGGGVRLGRDHLLHSLGEAEVLPLPKTAPGFVWQLPHDGFLGELAEEIFVAAARLEGACGGWRLSTGMDEC